MNPNILHVLESTFSLGAAHVNMQLVLNNISLDLPSLKHMKSNDFHVELYVLNVVHASKTSMTRVPRATSMTRVRRATSLTRF